MAKQAALLTALFAVRLAFSTFLLAASLSFFFLKQRPTSYSEIRSVVVAIKRPRRSFILSLLVLVALSYFLDGFALVLHSVLSKSWQGTPSLGWWHSQWSGLEVEALFGLLSAALLAILGTWKESQGMTVWTKWRPRIWTLAALVGSIVEIALLLATVEFIHKQPVSIPELPPIAQPKIPALLHTIFPILRLLILVPLYMALASPRVSYIPASEAHEAAGGDGHLATEETGLLDPQADVATEGQGIGLAGSSKVSQYGTFRPGHSAAPSTAPSVSAMSSADQDLLRPIKPSESDRQVQRTTSSAVENQTWSDLYQRLRKLSPYLWPRKSVQLQSLAVVCLIILVVGRLVNVALPLTLGKLVDIFEKQYSGTPTPKPQSFWPYLLLYVGLRFLQGRGGLNAIRDLLWTPVSQYSDREMSQLAFNHLLSLSLSFHLKRKTGEVLRILDRGQAINRLFELLLFSISPVLIDIFVALFIFVWKFGWELAVVVAFVMFGYITASITLTQWRTRIRRRMNDKDVAIRGIHTDCLINYETVKYFNGDDYERQRYAAAIGDYQRLEYKVAISLDLLNLVQNLMIGLGFLMGGMIVALRVTRGWNTSSEFVVFVAYLTQLFGPLDKLGTFYKQINTSMIDAEKLLNLLDEPADVNDRPNAPNLVVDGGEIEFDNVSFSYDGRRTALNNISFKVPKGCSVALVGESGSGKSTILRLMYRFYDLQEGEGRILIDGKDIRDITQASLRRAIGVIPQEPILFNNDIGYNIGYGHIGASHAEIEEAARAAQMHDRIMSFPDKYETKVGERGVHLSGGEKQRVAIARTLLKNPPILILDEATSALDTSTEKDIQKALQNLMEGRSSLSIAHRLSTIASADLILVLKNGQIVEQGSHRELLEKNGIFASMWADQVSAEEPLIPYPDQEDVKDVTGYAVEQNEPTKSSEQEEVPGEPIVSQSQEAILIDIDEGPSKSTAEEIKGDAEAEPAPSALAEEEERDSKEDSGKKSYAAVLASEPATVEKAEEDTNAGRTESSPAPAGSSDVPVSFPSYDPDATEPFPAPPQSPGVTFDEGTQFPEPRSGTPDPASEQKRKRTTSQNLQRFARRVSLVARRSGSTTSIPTPAGKKEDQSKSANNDGTAQAEGSIQGESPASSIHGEDGKRVKKERKGRKRFTLK